MAKAIAKTKQTLLLRTHFGDDGAWKAVCAEIEKPVGEVRARVTPLSDPQYDGASVDDVVRAAESNHELVLVADRETLTNAEHPVLVIDLDEERGRTFRVIPREAWSVENNLSLANMDFAEFADAVDEDGVFRGFPEDA